jgi:hypothetical protein
VSVCVLAYGSVSTKPDIRSPRCLVFFKCSSKIFLYLRMINVKIRWLNLIRKFSGVGLNDLILFNMNESSLNESDHQIDVHDYYFNVKLR